MFQQMQQNSHAKCTTNSGTVQVLNFLPSKKNEKWFEKLGDQYIENSSKTKRNGFSLSYWELQEMEDLRIIISCIAINSTDVTYCCKLDLQVDLQFVGGVVP